MISPPSLFSSAQEDMRLSYFGGAPGLVASAMVWLVSGLFALNSSPYNAVWALFIGGMFIFPLSIVISKAFGRSGKHLKGNPLGKLALEGTFVLIICAPLAYVVASYRIEWFFPAMLFVIGSRYLTFSTLYGLRIYWLCGATVIAVGCLLVLFQAPFAVGAFAGAAVELLFSIAVFAKARV